MSYWKDTMNWPIDKDWKCVICGSGPIMSGESYALLDSGLTWGLVHAECRCNICHTVYTMRDNSKEGRPRVTRPISLLKPDYVEPAKKAWARWHKPLDTLSDEEWIEVGASLQAQEMECASGD